MNAILKNGELFCKILDYKNLGEIGRDEVREFGRSEPIPVTIYNLYVVWLDRHLDEDNIGLTLELENKRGRISSFKNVTTNEHYITYDVITDYEEKK